MIIDYGKLEEGIRTVENAFIGYDQAEKELILRNVTERLIAAKQKQAQKDMTTQMMSKDFVKGLFKSVRNTEKDEEDL